MIRAIIVEDSRLARNELKLLLKQVENVEVVAECEDADSAIERIAELKPDLLFLDIQMPGKNGFELLDELEQLPQVIFTTAYDEYAVRSFEYEALDYLLKPIELDRLSQSLSRVEKKPSPETPVSKLKVGSSVFVKDGEQCWMLEIVKVGYFTSCGNYTHVHFDLHKPLIHKSLNQLEQRLPEELFFRANRQQIVNIKKISSIELAVNGNLELVMDDGNQIEVSRRHSARFKQLLSF